MRSYVFYAFQAYYPLTVVSAFRVDVLDAYDTYYVSTTLLARRRKFKPAGGLGFITGLGL